MKTVLVTGGTGYIGSHTVLSLIEQGFTPIIIDDLRNSSAAVLSRIQQLSGVKPMFIEADVRDPVALQEIFTQQEIDAVIHFAGLKAVGESVEKPLLYYSINLQGTIELLTAMQNNDCRKMVFSSSCTVYGQPETVPVTEEMPLSAASPYGHTKLAVENMLRNLAEIDDSWQFSILRYFNPVGAHESGEIGEDPNGTPNNLLPYISQVAVGRLAELSVWGDDYETPDGTGVRDYIHVMDLAEAHIKAVQVLDRAHGCQAYNIGTGQGYSVLEMIRAFEQASGLTIPYSIKPRRSGDIAECFADPTRSQHKLGWTANRGLAEMMRDQWNWQKNNPDGY